MRLPQTQTECTLRSSSLTKRPSDLNRCMRLHALSRLSSVVLIRSPSYSLFSFLCSLSLSLRTSSALSPSLSLTLPLSLHSYHLAAANAEEKASWLADLRSVVEIASQTYDSDSNEGDVETDSEADDASSSAGGASVSASASAGAERAPVSPEAGGRSVSRRDAARARDRAVLVDSLRLSSLSLALNGEIDSGNGDALLKGWLFKRARRKGASSMDSDTAENTTVGGAGAGSVSCNGEELPSGRGGENGGANSALRLAEAQVKSGQLPAKWKTANIHEVR